MSNQPVYITLKRPNGTSVDPGSTVKIYSTGALGGGLSEEATVEDRGLVYLPASWRGRDITDVYVTEKKNKWQLQKKTYIPRDRDSNDPVVIELKK